MDESCKPWPRVCYGCGKTTDDWEMMWPHHIARAYKPVPICDQCAQRERDYREEKGS